MLIKTINFFKLEYAVLSIRFEEGGYVSEAPAWEFPSWYPITSNHNKLASNRWSLNIHLFYNNCLIDHFISDQNLPFADMLPGFHTRSPLTEHMVNGDQNLSQLFLGNTKSFFCWRCMKCMLDYTHWSFSRCLILLKTLNMVSKICAAIKLILKDVWSYDCKLLWMQYIGSAGYSFWFSSSKYCL